MEKAEGKPRLKPTGKKAPSTKEEKPQHERFAETALALGADENKFEEAFRLLVPPKKVTLDRS